MSVHVRFTLKKPSTSVLMNKTIKKHFGEQIIFFANEIENQAWLNDINTDPKSNCAHLKPEGSNLTMDQLKKYFPTYTKEGVADLDIGFGRTSEQDMAKILAFVQENRKDFLQISGIHDLVERSETGKTYQALLYLDDTFPGAMSSLPETHKDYRAVFEQGCTAYIAGMNGTELGVLYGNVKHPTYMKARTTIDPADSPLIKDKQGRHILLVPLIPMDETAQDIAIGAFNHCIEMYIQEPMALFMAKVYPSMKPSDGYDIGAEEAKAILAYAKQKCGGCEKYSHFHADKAIVEYSAKNYNINELSTRANKLMKQAKTSFNECWWFVYAIASLRANKLNSSEVVGYYNTLTPQAQ